MILPGKHTDISNLLSEIARNDSQLAFNKLFKIYYEPIMRFVMLHISNVEDGEEIISDVFSAIWENRKDLLSVYDFVSYIYSIARHKVIDVYRRNKKNELFVFGDENFQLFFGTETSPEDNFISQEEVGRLNEAIEELPPKCKMIFKMIREDKLKYKQVAVILNLSEKTVEAQMSIALKKLRKAISEG